MTKKLTTLTDNETELDLSNPEVAKMIVAHDVTNKEIPREPTSAPKAGGKKTTFTMKLATEELAQIIREAGASGQAWQLYLEDRIREQVLSGRIGKAVIHAPSSMTQKITGPTGSVRRG